MIIGYYCWQQQLQCRAAKTPIPQPLLFLAIKLCATTPELRYRSVLSTTGSPPTVPSVRVTFPGTLLLVHALLTHLLLLLLVRVLAVRVECATHEEQVAGAQDEQDHDHLDEGHQDGEEVLQRGLFELLCSERKGRKNGTKLKHESHRNHERNAIKQMLASSKVKKNLNKKTKFSLLWCVCMSITVATVSMPRTHLTIQQQHHQKARFTHPCWP